MSVESVIPSNHLILCHTLLLPSIFPSIRVFSNESALLTRWPKYWSFSFSISPSNEYLGLTSFRMDWLDLLAVQGILKRLLHHYSSKALILRRSYFLKTKYMSRTQTIMDSNWWNKKWLSALGSFLFSSLQWTWTSEKWQILVPLWMQSGWLCSKVQWYHKWI